MALYHYKIKSGIFVVNVQAESWEEAVKKCIEAEVFDKEAKCIEVRRIRGKKED